MGYFSLIFRALRIFKVTKLEKMYLKNIYRLTKDFNPDDRPSSIDIVENKTSPNLSENDIANPIMNTN